MGLKNFRKKLEDKKMLREARELQNLRARRMKIEGRAAREELKKQERTRIKKARETIGPSPMAKGINQIIGSMKGMNMKGLDILGGSDKPGSGLESFDIFGSGKKKKKRDEFSIF